MFSITPVGGHEAVWFSMDWKVPCVLYWRQSSVSSLENEFGVGDLFAVTPPAISPEVLINVPKCATIIPLSPTEIPKQGKFIFSLDCWDLLMFLLLFFSGASTSVVRSVIS